MSTNKSTARDGSSLAAAYFIAGVVAETMLEIPTHTTNGKVMYDAKVASLTDELMVISALTGVNLEAMAMSIRRTHEEAAEHIDENAAASEEGAGSMLF